MILSLEVMFPGVPRGGNSLTPWEEWGLNPRAFASDLKADSLTTRTSSRFGLSLFWIFVYCFLFLGTPPYPSIITGV